MRENDTQGPSAWIGQSFIPGVGSLTASPTLWMGAEESGGDIWSCLPWFTGDSSPIHDRCGSGVSSDGGSIGRQ